MKAQFTTVGKAWQEECEAAEWVYSIYSQEAERDRGRHRHRETQTEIWWVPTSFLILFSPGPPTHRMALPPLEWVNKPSVLTEMTRTLSPR